MNKFTVEANKYLHSNIQGFHHTDYLRYDMPGNPDYLNYLKNTFDSYAATKLERAEEQLERVLMHDLPKVVDSVDSDNVVICVMPRAKSKDEYTDDQLRFSSTVSNVVDSIQGVLNGCDFITRHTSTRTTHLRNHDTSGSLPYVGITEDTCDISSKIKGKDVILVDDIYTKDVNVNEDAIQAILNAGAKSVALYVVANTKKKH